MDALNDILIEAVKAAGGSANVGAKLWPEKAPQHAQRALLDCLNEDRPAKLSPEQVMLIIRFAKDKGHHGAIAFILQSLSYAPTTPIEPRDEAAELQKQFIAATHAMQELSKRMESLTARPMLRSAA